MISDAGSQATVAITLLVKNPNRSGSATIQYTDIGDYLTREEKIAKIAEAGGGQRHPCPDIGRDSASNNATA